MGRNRLEYLFYGLCLFMFAFVFVVFLSGGIEEYPLHVLPFRMSNVFSLFDVASMGIVIGCLGLSYKKGHRSALFVIPIVGGLVLLVLAEWPFSRIGFWGVFIAGIAALIVYFVKVHRYGFD